MHLPKLGSRFCIAMLATIVFASAPHAQERVASSAGIRTYDLCARGLNNDPAKPFTQTLRVKVSLSGPPIDDESVRKIALAQLILTMVWKDRASEVFVEDFDEIECAASAGNRAEIAAELSQNDIDAIWGIERGPGVIGPIVEIAKLAKLRLDMAIPTPGAQKQWLSVFFATNREPTQKTATADAFGTKRADALAYGAVDVAVLQQKKNARS